jgi:hypothetical protein
MVMHLSLAAPVSSGHWVSKVNRFRVTIPPLMPIQVLQRPYWIGTPITLGELFILHKNRREARAVLFTHQLGWEVRLVVGAQSEVVQTQVCRTQEEVLATGEQWKAGMAEKGWR